MKKITTEQARNWCAYLGAFHTAMGNQVALPISPNCSNLTRNFGCGTCYGCTEQIILRALFTSSHQDPNELPRSAHAINDAVFQYVTDLDPERLTSADGSGDDYARMTSVQYSRVMNWAATFVRRAQAAPQYMVKVLDSATSGPREHWFNTRDERAAWCLENNYSSMRILGHSDPEADARPSVFDVDNLTSAAR